MKIECRVEYLGDLRTRAVHGPSQAEILTDAPVDNHGKGEAFSPTDLVGTAMATCMLTIMGIAARGLQVNIEGATARVTKEMTAVPLRRISRLELEISTPLPADHVACAALEKAARTCPVAASMHPDVAVILNFVWSGSPSGAL